MSQQLNRRRFLGNAAAGGAAAGLTFSTIKTLGAEAPSNKVVVGVMGLSRGRSLATGFAKQPGVEVKYVCDVDENRANSCADLAKLFYLPMVKGKTRLNILCAFTP